VSPSQIASRTGVTPPLRPFENFNAYRRVNRRDASKCSLCRSGSAYHVTQPRHPTSSLNGGTNQQAVFHSSVDQPRAVPPQLAALKLRAGTFGVGGGIKSRKGTERSVPLVQKMKGSDQAVPITPITPITPQQIMSYQPVELPCL
jgi:hypothetical protein